MGTIVCSLILGYLWVTCVWGKRWMFSERPAPNATEQAQLRVAYGAIVEPTLMSYVVEVAIVRNDGIETLCGGSLIAPDVVQTAAHCLLNKKGQMEFKAIRAHVRSSPSTANTAHTTISVNTNQVAVPSSFDPSIADSYYGDIALMKLEKASQAWPVQIAGPDYANLQPHDVVVVAGFGETAVSSSESKQLRFVTVPIVDRVTAMALEPTMEPDHFAAGMGNNHQDACAGDSGSPAIIPGKQWYEQGILTNREAAKTAPDKDLLLGTVSYGLYQQCGLPGNLGYYTNITDWDPWIQTTLKTWNKQDNNGSYNNM